MERFGREGMILRGEIEWLGNRMVKWGRERVMELQREKIYESCARSEEERDLCGLFFTRDFKVAGDQ